MKKNVAILLIVCCFLFSACKLAPFEEQISDAKLQKTFRVYVCGAVKNEGYVEVSEGADYVALVLAAGVVEQTRYPEKPLTLVTENTVQLTVCYCLNGKIFCCENLNGVRVSSRMEVENVSPHVIDKIADFLQSGEKITDKNQLREILGEKDFSENHYKFFVSVEDYEKSN